MLTTNPTQDLARVLIIDDDRTTRLLARASLEQNGFQVAEAEDGVLSLAAFQDFRPDLILLDVLMPNMDGFATCTTLRHGISREGKCSPLSSSPVWTIWSR